MYDLKLHHDGAEGARQVLVLARDVAITVLRIDSRQFNLSERSTSRMHHCTHRRVQASSQSYSLIPVSH